MIGGEIVPILEAIEFSSKDELLTKLRDMREATVRLAPADRRVVKQMLGIAIQEVCYTSERELLRYKGYTDYKKGKRKKEAANKSLNRKQKSQGMKEQANIPLASSDLGWHISASRSYEITTPKNKSSYRNVLMPMNLVKMLWEHQKRCKEEYGYSSDWFVFGGEEPLSDQTIRRRLNEY